MTEELIRREAAIDACLNGWNKDYKEIVKEIRALPTVQQKEGHWLPVGHDINDYPYFKCSECGRVDDAKGSWCRWCGCLMSDGENKPIQATKPCNYSPDEEIDVIRHHITDETYQHLLDNK